MDTIKKKVIINAPIEKVFAFLVDPRKIPLVMPALIENKNIPKLPLKEGSKFNYVYQLYGVKLEGKWTVTKIKKPTEYWAVTDGGSWSEWKYTLSKKGKGTLINFTLNYKIPHSVLTKIKQGILNKMNEKEADHFFHNLKTVLEM
ncbi:MAG: SRPBCC family protein [Nanoarchaeota archaeon]